MFVEGVQPFLDGLYVIVDAAGRFATLQQTPGHCFVTNLEVQNLRAGTDFLFKFLSLSDFTWISVIRLEYTYMYLLSILIHNSGNALARVQRVHESVDLCDITFHTTYS